jgi:hemin uptake protein HemP
MIVAFIWLVASLEDDAMNADQEAARGGAEPPPSSVLPKIIQFEDLVICGDEVWIQFKGQLYRLRRTKQDKLILTK